MVFNLLKRRWKLVAAGSLLVFVLLGAWQQDKSFTRYLPPPNTARSADLTVIQEGMYQIPVASLGWDGIKLENLQLFHSDRPIPIWVTGEGRGANIHFYGEASDSIYLKHNVYQLKIGENPGLRIPEITQPPGLHTASLEIFTSTVRLEKNAIYLPMVDQGDHWFWTKLAAPTIYSLKFELEEVAPGNGRVKAAFWGNTQAAATPNHNVLVRINGFQVAGETWDGQTRQTLEGVIPSGILDEGYNTLEIESPGVAGVFVDIVSLDWIEISYPHRSVLAAGQTTFTTREGVIQFTGMDHEIHLFDITHPANPTLRIVGGNSPIFPAEAGHRYIAVQPGSWLQPHQVESTVLAPDLKTHPGADYLVIGPEDFLAPLTPLLDWRNQQGMVTGQIPISAIYDQFNGGLEEPQAFQAFLKYAASHWAIPPRYVLLVGDSSYDFYGYTGAENRNHLPALMIQTVFGGETASDVFLANIDDDPWPDLALGRIPAQTRDQVQTYVEKVLRYEREGANRPSNPKILAVADGQEKIFSSDALRFLDSFPDHFATTLLAQDAGDANANQELIQEINKGYWLVAYFGHGSINMWGKDSIFTTGDIQNLSATSHPPVMLHFTCLTGLFTHPQQESLAEGLLWRPQGGAIAVIAPTSLTLPYEQEYLATAFVQALVQTPGSRLGDVLLAAWRQVPAEGGNSLDVMRTFLLFGDPALKLTAFSP